ncbi:MAG: hypothetical protein LKI53_02355 [Bacteroidales bacterium]|jgi:hypothetical protein|nr:hypothetical protein [Bacteroidales bacterium]
MSEKKFILTTYRRGARPRSKRLRELGGGAPGGSTGSTVVNVSGEIGNDADSHRHANKTALDQISVDENGYLYLTQPREVLDDRGNIVLQYVTEKVKAGLADLAKDLTPDSPVREQFLSRLADDVAKGNLTFEKMLTVLGLAVFKDGAQYGTFVKDLYSGTGAGIDKLGNAEFESVRVRTYFECLELIINRLTAIEGDQLLTEADTIESVDDLGNRCYGLHLRRKWDGYFTAQAQNNVLKGIINTLAAGSGQYYTSWMRVNSVNTANNYIEVTLYDDADTPSGSNYPPCEMMNIARWGNQTDTRRQSCIYLSSTEGRIVRLTGVTKPIIDVENYGATFGTLPEFLQTMDLPIIEGQDYVYARGLIVQDIIRIDYQGRPVSEIVDRGQWSATADYYAATLNPTTNVYEVSDVWYKGCRYRCALTGTHTAPAWNNTDWGMVEGNPEFTVDFEDTDYIFDPDRFNLTLTIVAKLHNQDITDDILANDVAWTRYSEDADGNERVASDNAWAISRAGAGKSIDLTTADCDFNGYVPKVLKFIATVTLRDGAGEALGTETTIFQY